VSECLQGTVPVAVYGAAWLPELLFFFFITLKPRVERYTQSMRLKYEPASEPLHIYVK